MHWRSTPPPTRLPNGAIGRELWVECGAKAHEARNWVRFGEWQVNPADNYGFWRPQSPVWVYSLAGFLDVFGVSTLALRSHSILVAAVGFGVALRYARKRLGAPALAMFGAFLAGNCYYIFYTRAGLIEPMVNLFAAGTALSAHRALSEPRWLVAGTVCLLLAVFSKTSGLFMLPVLACAAAASLHRAMRSGLARSTWPVPLAVSTLLLLAAAAYMTTDAFQQRAGWSYGHMVHNEAGTTEIDGSKLDLTTILARPFDLERWTKHFFPLFPLASALSVVTLVHSAKAFVKTRTIDWDVLTALWFLAAFASLQVTSRTHVRYYVVLFPPVALLGARGLELLAGTVKQRCRRMPAALFTAVLVSFSWYHGSSYLRWWQHRTYTIRDTNRAVQELLADRDDAVVVGLWSPWLTFDTPHQNYIIRDYFNVEKEALARLRVTHLLALPKDIPGSVVRRHFPKQYRAKKKLKTFRVYGQTLTLYEFPSPIGQRP